MFENAEYGPNWEGAGLFYCPLNYCTSLGVSMSSLSDSLHFRALSFKSNKSGRSQQFFKIGLLKNYRFLFTFKVTLGATLNSSRIASNNSFKTAFANAFRFNSSINLFIVSVRIKQNTFVSSAVELFVVFFSSLLLLRAFLHAPSECFLMWSRAEQTSHLFIVFLFHKNKISWVYSVSEFQIDSH